MANVTEGVMDRVVLWMVSGLSGDDLLNACVGKLGLSEAAAKRVVAQAKKRITTAVHAIDRDEMLGTALTRLNDLYARALRQQDEGRALSVQREINRLIGLYWGEQIGEATEDELGREAVEELAAMREYLAPLGLGESPLREQVRILVQRLCQPKE